MPGESANRQKIKKEKEALAEFYKIVMYFKRLTKRKTSKTLRYDKKKRSEYLKVQATTTNTPAIMFAKSLTQSTVPRDWKFAGVFAIFNLIEHLEIITN